ncbi:MAG TPA: response regulator transcription factor [Ignavibacteria bacterium]
MKKYTAKIRLLVIEDNRVLREGIVSILKPHRDISIIAESGKSENTILKIHKHKPNVILLDLGLRSQNSLILVERVKKEFPDSKVIVMDLVPVQADIIQFVKAGASGFLLKNTTLDEFLATIRAVAEGVKVLPPHLNDSLFTQIIEFAIKSGKTKLINAVKMTKREIEILTLIGDGFTNKKMAQKLHMSDYSVKSHIHNILEKLALRTRIEQSNKIAGTGSIKAFTDSISMFEK